jgi:RNA polymerase sigma-70 factor (sigma-E family)
VSGTSDYASFYAATWSRLLRTTYAICGDHQLAEDALQSAFAHAYASWSRVQRADDSLAYVRRIAVNAALKQQGRAFRRRESVVESLPEPASMAAQDAVGAHDEMWMAVQTLPPRQRAVVVLRYYEDLTEREIAEVLRCRPGTVKSQASAALARLRAVLQEPASEGDRQ